MIVIFSMDSLYCWFCRLFNDIIF